MAAKDPEEGKQDFPLTLEIDLAGKRYALSVPVFLTPGESMDVLRRVANHESLSAILAQKWADSQGGNLKEVEGAQLVLTAPSGRRGGSAGSAGTGSGGGGAAADHWTNQQKGAVNLLEIPQYGGRGKKSPERRLWEEAVRYEGKVSVPEAEKADGAKEYPANEVPWREAAGLA